MARPGRPAGPKPVLNPLIEAFLDMLTTERGAAMNTRQAYWRDLADISLYLKNNDHADIDKATTSDIEAYLKDLNKRTTSKNNETTNIAVRTIARRLSAMRQFYHYLISEGKREDDPTSTIESPKQKRTVPKTLTKEEINHLIKTAGEMKSKESLRLVCLIEMLYATGLRVSELVGLPLSAIGENNEFIIVTGKAGRERMVPLSTPAQKALKSYMDEKDAKTQDSNESKEEKWLFPSKTSGSGHLTRQRFAQLLKDLSKEAKMTDGKVSPHIIRHAFATHLLSNGADLRSVQKMLGHADIATTQIYTHILSDNLKETVKDKHPLSKAGNKK